MKQWIERARQWQQELERCREHVPDLRTLTFVLTTVCLSIVWTVGMARWSGSDGKTAAALAMVQLFLYTAFVLRTRDAGICRLLLFGLVFGIVELVADALCVYFTGTLDYSPSGSAMIWLSPWWMPFAWMIVTVQIGFLGFWIIQKVGILRGALLTGLIGAVNIPFYEEMAYHADWWQYLNCRMIAHTPLYIIVAELLIGLALGPVAAAAYCAHTYRSAGVLGAIGGVSTIIGGLIGYGLLEIIVPALLGEPIPFFVRFFPQWAS
ncbi:MAG: hypothetical protein OHK0029_19520 [Armatimonadaceae bacterium]